MEMDSESWERIPSVTMPGVVLQLANVGDDLWAACKITQAELIEMFGESMPIEAVNLLWDGVIILGIPKALCHDGIAKC